MQAEARTEGTGVTTLSLKNIHKLSLHVHVPKSKEYGAGKSNFQAAFANFTIIRKGFLKRPSISKLCAGKTIYF